MSSFWLISIFTLFLVGCSDSPEIKKQGDSFKIKLTPAKLLNLDHRKWYVGKIGRDVVSKGLRIHYRLPQFRQPELKELLREGFLDSLLIRLKKRTYSESVTLDTFYISLGRKRSDMESDYLITQLKEINLLLVYSAASVERLARLMCPAMKHRYFLDDYEIGGPMGKGAVFVVNAKSAYSDYMSKIEPFDGSRHVINGGKSLIGTYYLEMAFYDSIKRKRVGNFLPSSESFRILDEEVVDIPFCDDPKNSDKSMNDNVRSFKFGR